MADLHAENLVQIPQNSSGKKHQATQSPQGRATSDPNSTPEDLRGLACDRLAAYPVRMTPVQTLGLFGAACAAGVINSIAGGGTLITFPFLIFLGVPPVVANATSTMALVIGTSGTVYGYRSHLSSVRSWFGILIPVSIAGGWIGSYLLTFGGDRIFAGLVPYLILFATLLFMGQGAIRSRLTRRGDAGELATHPRRHRVAALLFQFLVSIYGGYFGAGIGILMLAALGILGFKNIHAMNALKSLLGLLINITAALWFAAEGLVDWKIAGIMTAGSILGGYYGSTWAQTLPQSRVRTLITLTGLAITAAMFWKFH